jgi:hypothetical protein
VPKPSPAISCTNVELKSNISEISSISVMRADVADIYMSLSNQRLFPSVYYAVGGWRQTMVIHPILTYHHVA